jgi:peptide deformylase
MIRPVLQSPHPMLRAVSAPVAVFGVAERAIANDLLDTMRKLRAAGLAAVQIGKPVRIVAISAQAGGWKFPFPVLVNPVVLKVWGRNEMEAEGCHSIDNGLERSRRPVVRQCSIRVRFTDRADMVQELDVIGFAARVIQHEVDHLDGKMIA